MATVAPHRRTLEHLLAIDDRPPPDLVDGEFEERAIKGHAADAIVMRVGHHLMDWALDTNAGDIQGPTAGYQLFPDAPSKVRFPDVSFTRRDRLPAARPKGVSRLMPDLVVEVVSPNDNAAQLRREVRDFLAAGVPLIWVVNPDSRDVQVTRADGTGELLGEGDTLRGGDVLPGFERLVVDMFI